MTPPARSPWPTTDTEEDQALDITSPEVRERLAEELGRTIRAGLVNPGWKLAARRAVAAGIRSGLIHPPGAGQKV